MKYSIVSVFYLKTFIIKKIANLNCLNCQLVVNKVGTKNTKASSPNTEHSFKTGK